MSKGVMDIVKIGDCTLIHGDCMDVLPRLAKVDAVVTDPPYGLNQNAYKVANRGKLAKTTDYGDFDWDKAPASNEQINAILNAAKHAIIWGGNYFDLPPSSGWLVWDKENGKSNFADCELAWTNLPMAVRLFQHMWNGMLRASEKGQPRVHPTQKPVVLMDWCIRFLPPESKTILDPFMGSGTTLVSCVKAGKPGIGIELGEKNFQIACQRVREAYAQPDMFIQNGTLAQPEQIDLTDYLKEAS